MSLLENNGKADLIVRFYFQDDDDEWDTDPDFEVTSFTFLEIGN